MIDRACGAHGVTRPTSEGVGIVTSSRWECGLGCGGCLFFDFFQRLDELLRAPDFVGALLFEGPVGEESASGDWGYERWNGGPRKLGIRGRIAVVTLVFDGADFFDFF